MITLHSYILRELLKTFGLTLVALTGMFALCGGLVNVMLLEGVTAGDLFTVLPMLIPIAITVTMPVAALFAATMVYGRLAADNELVACRAAGINVHRTFFAAVLLSLFVALFTAVSVNVVIPRFMKQIEYFARLNIRDLAFSRLTQRGYIHYGKAGKGNYMLTAQDVQNVSERQLIEKGFDPPDDHIGYFWLDQPTFLMIDGRGELKRFAVAEGGLCQFDTRDTQVNVTIYVKDAREYEVGKSAVQTPLQKIGPYPAPIRFPVRPSMVDLGTLREWREAPWEAPDTLAEIERFRDRLRCYLFCADAARNLAGGRALTLDDGAGARLEISAASCAVETIDLSLREVSVARHVPGAARPERYTALRAKLFAQPQGNRDTAIELLLESARDRPVLEYPSSSDYQRPLEKDAVRLAGLRLPERVLDAMARCTPAAVLDPDVELPGADRFGEERAKIRKSAERLQRKAGALIHFRLGFATSALVTILMGAALGVIFRGSRALAAFGLACIPFGIVTLLMLEGKLMAEKEGLEAVGPAIIWGGLALIGLADALILRLGVRR